MTQVPQKALVPNNTPITKTPEEGRALAVMLARNSIHAMQGGSVAQYPLSGEKRKTSALGEYFAF